MKIKKIPTEDIAITYKTSLLQHRESIIHNKYARELESRYHKSNQKSYTFTPKKSPNQTPINTHL